jgi:hypothetical protein
LRALLWLGLMASAHAAEIVTPTWDAQGRFALQRELAAGKALEICQALKPGERVAWSFSAAAPLAFNLHHHEGKKVVFAEDRKGVSQLQGEFAPSLAQDYCWMWQAAKDAAAPVALRLELRRP